MIAIFFCISFGYSQEVNLNVLEDWIEWSNGEQMPSLFLNDQAHKYLDIRENEINQLKTKTDWLNRQKKVKDILMKIVGPFPEKTDLNPRVTGVVQKEGFRIEKIIYESMPDYYVTGCLFIPDDINDKRPAILNLIGHTLESFRSKRLDYYQPVILNLVKKGFIVFAIDPEGQGERTQYTDDEKKQAGWFGQSSTREHSYIANQCFLSGSSIAKYWIWDGMRAIDYLLTRDEIDPNRIGVTGLSGGGTATAYIAAFDGRVAAAASAGYICGFRRLLQSIGPQDGEQIFYHGIANGLDHADLIEQFAPKPFLIVSTTRDFFSIQGARETYAEVKLAYTALGEEKNIQMCEDDHGHAYTKLNREALNRFFQESLNLPGNSADEEITILDSLYLTVTTTGQILTSLGGISLSEISKHESQELLDQLEQSRKNISEHLLKVNKMAGKLSGYKDPEKEGDLVFRGRYKREGYSIEKYVLSGENKYVIPMILAVPDTGSIHPAIIYLNPEGKSDSLTRYHTEQLAKKGFLVAVPDLIGLGETGDPSGYPGRLSYGPVLIGRSLVGIHAGDIVRVVNMLKKRDDVQKENIGSVAFGELCPALIHASAFESSINKTVLIDALISYKEIINNKVYNYSLSFKWGVAGALTAYDLPDLAGCVAPRNLYLINPKNAMKETASKKLIDDEMDITRKAYALHDASGGLIIEENKFYEYLETIKNWWSD